MDKKKEFEKVVREHLGLKEDVEIVDVAVTIKREDVIHVPGAAKVDITVITDDIKNNGVLRKHLKDINSDTTDNKPGKQKRKYKKRTKAKINPLTGQKKRKIKARLDLTVTDQNIEYAKKKLQQWNWTKKFTEEEKNYWDSLKGGSLKKMDQTKKDNIINLYNRTAKRISGE